MKHFFIYFFILIIFFSFSFSQESSNQDMAEMGFSELEGELKLLFKDAVNANPISNATMTINNKEYQTNYDGFVKLPLTMIEDFFDKRIPFVVKKKGYIPLKSELKVKAGTVIFKTFYLSKCLPLDNVRFVLQCGKRPYYLDLHLISDHFHVSYRDMKNAPNQAQLDRDDTNSYGPETITLEKIEEVQIYSVYVHNYSNDSKIADNSRVTIFANNKTQKTINLPNTKKRFVKILEIKNNKIIYLNNPKRMID